MRGNFMITDYERLATGRGTSLFATDLSNCADTLRERLGGARVAVVGAAGSIGSAVVKILTEHNLAALVLFDLSENNLVELVRDLRSIDGLRLPEGFATLPIGMGSVEFARCFAEQAPFDYFLNLAAIKHVRSEKDVYCLVRMVDTNVLFLYDFLQNNPYCFRKAFSVSSDKATNPANLMGATKMAMEYALLAESDRQPFSTARFANVAFSDGSLPYGFLRRIEKRQPLSAPSDVRRYFISHREAGELCIMAAVLGENRDVFFPKLQSGSDERTFSQIAIDLLEHVGYEPCLCSSEEEARQRAVELIPTGRWPCYFFDTDTTGEKAFEEFFTDGEDVDLEQFENLGVIRRSALGDRGALDDFLSFARKAKHRRNVTKADYVRAFRTLVPTLRHQETGRNLDQKM